MLINCSDFCIHSVEGICTLNHIMHSSIDGNEKCPFYKRKNTPKKLNKNEKFLNNKNQIIFKP